jgi:translation initiation factor IF-2
MGHIDHGKTTLLDHLSNMKVAASEPGFITQDVRAVTLAVKPFSDKEFTFLDTPGHFHFDRMRENSAVVADAVLLVIAADEGLLAQSYDVIQWALEYDLPLIVCINKIDLCTPARLTSLRRRIQKAGVRKTDHLLEISALHGTNIDQLKQTLAIVTDKCGKLVNRHDPAEAVVLESSYKPGAGIILKALIQCGTLEVGQHFVCGYIKGRVRAILDPMGNRLKVAHPGCLVEVMGGRQSEIDASIEPPLGDTLFVVSKDRADEIMEVRHLQRRFSNARMEKVVPEPPMSEEERKDIEHQLRNPHLLTPVEEEKTLSLIIKADTAGALDVLRQYLLDIPGITILSSSIGEVSLKDLDNSIHADYCPIICYRITPTLNVRRTATNKKVKIYFDNVLHRLIDMARDQAGAEKPFANMKPIADQGKEEVYIM